MSTPAAATASAFTCSGSSPTPAGHPAPWLPGTLGFSTPSVLPSVPTIHLLGPGQVGRAFLDRIAHLPHLRLIAVSDSTATLFNPRGLDPRAVAAWKARGKTLRSHRGALDVSTDEALAQVGADLIVDSTPTDLAQPEIAARRCRQALERGARLALAAKDALCFAAEELLSLRHRARVGFHAVLGGTGAYLGQELTDLRAACTEVEIVGNASTTAVIEEIEAGESLAQGIERATRRGLLETDPSQDLNGSDAAVKLAIVVRALWGFDLSPSDIPWPDLRDLDLVALRERHARRTTTRLVGRADREGAASLAYEEVPRGSHLAVPSDRVVYAYRTARGLRVHVGSGLGPDRTADALLVDVRHLTGAPAESRIARGGAR